MSAMCGRYDLSENPAAIRAKFHVPGVPVFAPNADVRPTNLAPIVRRQPDAQRECVLARWGLVPHWAPDLKFGVKCFNARCETIATAPSFRAAVKTRRCLVPMNAFFEWSGPAGHRIKHRIRPESQGLFALAGLWERWGQSPNVVESYTIITCTPNDALAPIHSRMPVILDEANYDAWLGEARLDLLRPYAGALRIEPAPN
jgi:putative SOS response-associated peptidase YedK